MCSAHPALSLVEASGRSISMFKVAEVVAAKAVPSSFTSIKVPFTAAIVLKISCVLNFVKDKKI
jgi:hypothetical protein